MPKNKGLEKKWKRQEQIYGKRKIKTEGSDKYIVYLKEDKKRNLNDQNKNLNENGKKLRYMGFFGMYIFREQIQPPNYLSSSCS